MVPVKGVNVMNILCSNDPSQTHTENWTEELDDRCVGGGDPVKAKKI